VNRARRIKPTFWTLLRPRWVVVAGLPGLVITVIVMVLAPGSELVRLLCGPLAVVATCGLLSSTARYERQTSRRLSRLHSLIGRIIRSRQELVITYDRERERLRRDLHDCLGPELATVIMRVDVIRHMLATDPEGMDARLVELRDDAQSAMAEMRRLINELGPPDVGSHDLLSSLRSQAARFTRASAGRLDIAVVSRGDIGLVEPAITVAILCIVSEALTNVMRHSHGTRCVVRVTVTDRLTVEVVDNGKGITGRIRAGVGLRSIKERSREHGGTCRVDRVHPQGTAVRVEFPLGHLAEAAADGTS